MKSELIVFMRDAALFMFLKVRQVFSLVHFKMSNTQPIIQESKLTSWEVELIKAKLVAGGTPMTIATEIITAVKKNFSIDRTHEEILQAIESISQSIPPPNPKPSFHDTPAPLFKKFQDVPSMQHEEPVRGINLPKPKRKSRLQFHNSRKIPLKHSTQIRSSWTMQQRLDELEQINEQCSHTIDKYDRKLNKKISTKELNSVSENIAWFYHQFFYSNYDKEYFSNGAMGEIKSKVFGGKETTFKDHKKLLGALPRPRIFNEEIVMEEKIKLEQYRNECRQRNKILAKNNESELAIQSVVLALHPMCGHLHLGSILAIYKENLYMVKFIKQQLPTQKILDVNMTTDFIEVTQGLRGKQDTDNKQKNKTRINNENIHSDVVENINFQSTAFLIKVLSLKSKLVEVIKSINDAFEDSDRHQKQKFQETLKWMIGLARKLQAIVQQSVLRFRLRGINQNNSKAFFNNLKHILVNPLKMMSKEFDHSMDEADQRAALQIKAILAQERQNLVNSTMENAVSKIEDTQKIDQNLKDLIRSCLGVLADLKHEGRCFDVQNNPNLLKLASLTGQDQREGFNEIYERLYSLVSKIRQ